MTVRTIVTRASSLALLSGVLACGAAYSTLGLTAPATAQTTPAADAETVTDWAIDPVHSSLLFKIKYANLSNFWGRFNEYSGSIVFDPANPTAAKAEIEIKATSVDTGIGNRDNHLRTPDFFNIESHPAITFKSTGVKPGAAKDTYEITGDLTFMGVTKTVHGTLEYFGQKNAGRAGYRGGFDATFTFKRSDFGMSYGVEAGALGDEVTVIASLSTVKKKQD